MLVRNCLCAILFQEASEPFQITPEFQHRYATLILRLDELNQQLKHHIGVVIHHITEVSTFSLNLPTPVVNWEFS